MPRQPLEDDQIQAIQERCRAATRGPWKAYIEGRDHTSGSDFIRTGGPEDIELSGATPADYDFIACARQDVPILLAEVERLREILRGTER